MREIVETFSAVEVPKKDGKGNLYAEVIRTYVSLIEVMQTASRKAFKRAFR